MIVANKFRVRRSIRAITSAESRDNFTNSAANGARTCPTRLMFPLDASLMAPRCMSARISSIVHSGSVLNIDSILHGY
jgi:hypothetical protein